MSSTLMRLLRNDEGATAIEYGLIAALIAVAAISALQLAGFQPQFNVPQRRD